MTRTAWSTVLSLTCAAISGCAGVSRMEEAQTAYDAGDYDRAIQWSSLSIDNGEAGGYLLRGKSYEKKGDPLKAVADYDHARQEAPDQGEPALREAKCYLSVGRPADAEATIAGAIKTGSTVYSLRDQLLVHAMHGEIQLAVGDFPRANDSFGEALKVARLSKPLEAEAATGIVHYNQSRTNFELGAYRRARESFQAYLGIRESAGGVDPQDLYTLA